MKVGFTCSSFDLLHAGHILMLKEAKENCDYLVVGLQTDPTIDRKEKNKPIMSLSERFIILSGVKYIDEIIPYETEEELEELLLAINPDIRFIGEDWKDKQITGEFLKIPIYWIKRKHHYSSTKLRERLNRTT